MCEQGWVQYHNYNRIIFQICDINQITNPITSKLQILKIKLVGVMPIISPAKIRHKYIFMMIPLVIGFQMYPFLKNDIVLVSPAINNKGMSEYSKTKTIFCIKPSRYIQALCIQNRSYPTLIVRYNANKVPMIKNEPIIAL